MAELKKEGLAEVKNNPEITEDGKHIVICLQIQTLNAD